MRLVDDDRKTAVAMLAADVVEDEREFLNCGGDDLLAALDETAQIARMLGMPDSRTDLGELPDRMADLLVEDAPGVTSRSAITPLRDPGTARGVIVGAFVRIPYM